MWSARCGACTTSRSAWPGRNHRKVSPYLFANAQGEPVHPDTFTKRLRKIFRELGFPSSFHLHTLRHYFVSTMLHEGVDKQTVAELAGHGDTSSWRGHTAIPR